jgi:hypothetical protein
VLVSSVKPFHNVYVFQNNLLHIKKIQNVCDLKSFQEKKKEKEEEKEEKEAETFRF